MLRLGTLWVLALGLWRINKGRAPWRAARRSR
jgi:hypothetical protein